jgi:ribonuclease P protein component
VAAESSRPEGHTVGSASPSDTPPPCESFSPADRVLRSADFERTYKEGRRLTSTSFAVFTLPNSLGHSRLGLTVTRKFGTAVKRNRYKRIVREIFRKNRGAFGDSRDYVVNIRSGALGRPYADLERDMLQLVSKAGGTARR